MIDLYVNSQLRHKGPVNEMSGQMGDGAPEELSGIAQLAEELGLTPRAIRFYEDKGLIQPQRAGTTRVYTHREFARMKLILRGKRLGFSLKEIKDFLDLYSVDHLQQDRALLDAVRARAALLEEQRTALDETLTELTEIESQLVDRLG